jgi:hypothetical protein
VPVRFLRAYTNTGNMENIEKLVSKYEKNQTLTQ